MSIVIKSCLKISVFAILVISSFNYPVLAQQRQYTVSNAHAHNDYIHPVPFYTAYKAGFGSIEADIFLKNDELYVAHDTNSITADRTLRSLYLDPLKEVIEKNRGAAYKDTSKKLLLLIDLKTKAEPTLNKLIAVLKGYTSIINCPTLKIVITGNQPEQSSFNSYPFFIHFDGNLEKLYSTEELKRIALFSGNFRNYSKWKGEHKLNETDSIKTAGLVTKAHNLNKPIRFWAAPDLQNAWQQLMQLNVDYINTDKIEEISAYLGKTKQ